MAALKNKRWEAFCHEYIKLDQNATQAAIAAGFKEHSAGRKGHILKNDARIMARIDELQKATIERRGVELDELVEWLRHIAEADATQAFSQLDGEGITLADLKRLPKDVRLCIQEVRATKAGLTVKFYNRLDALDKLMRFAGGYAADNAQRVGEFVTDEEIDQLLEGE